MAAEEDELTIDELAWATGMTTRNLRALQSSGLLDPPRIEGRRGNYGPAHLERVRAVRRLQGEGFSLAAIRSLFQAAGRGLTLEDVLGIGAVERSDAATQEDEQLGYGWVDGGPDGRRARLALVPSSFLEEPTAS